MTEETKILLWFRQFVEGHTIFCAHHWVEKYGNRGQKTMDAICTKCGKVDGYWKIKSQ